MSLKSTTKLKERLKSLKKIEPKMFEEPTLQDKINELKSRLKSCENDLKNPQFSENRNIINKIDNMKKQLERLENDK